MIDFKKVDAAFQHLANDPKGQSQLAEFGAAIGKLKGALPSLNEFEAQYVAANLLQQRVGVQSNIVNAGGVKVVHGFVIKSAVKE
jgi:hypothetical protein